MKTVTTKSLMLTLFTLLLVIFDVSSGYAITFSEPQKLLASDGKMNDQFGFSVMITGDMAVIGAPSDSDNGRDSGSAYVFVRDGAGVWREQQKLTASDGAEDDRFGFSVSISGNTTVIGAIRDEDNGEESGSAYVFVRSGTVWREQQKLTASDGAAFDTFGRSVSISGNTAVIGANNETAYVFVHDATGVWSEQKKLMASDGAAFDTFGRSVSISGNTAVIGAFGDDDNGDSTGSTYVFVRSGTVWREQQKLTASDGAAFDTFGSSVSISGDTAIIGADYDDDNGRDSGSAYVFVRSGTVWREQQKLTASDGTGNDLFGKLVSVSGNTAVIGSQNESAYVFVRDDTGMWLEQQKLTANDGAERDRFGESVSISGETVVIGADLDSDKGEHSGSAYVFEVSDPNNDLLTLDKLINHRVRETSAEAAQLLAGTRYRADYKVTNNNPNRIYRVRVFEGGQLVCNLYALDPGESMQPSRCTNFQDVLAGLNNVPANVTAKVSGTNEELANQTNAYYNGFGDVPGKLSVTHYVNDKNAGTLSSAVQVNDHLAEILFRVENTGSIKLYRVKTYHDPASPVNSGWEEQCFFGTMMPGQVRYCKRTISVTSAGLNKAFGRAQGEDANVSPIGYVNAANPTYFNVVLP